MLRFNRLFLRPLRVSSQIKSLASNLWCSRRDFSEQNKIKKDQQKTQFSAQELKNFFKKAGKEYASKVQKEKIQNQQVKFDDAFSTVDISQNTKNYQKQKFKTTSLHFKHLQKSAIDLGQEIHDAMSWLQECSQIQLNESLSLRDYNHINGMGYGLQVIQKDIQNRSVIMKVPISSCIIPQKLNFQYIKSISVPQDGNQKSGDYKYLQLLTRSIKKVGEQCCKSLIHHPDYQLYKTKLESLIFIALQVLIYDRKQSSSEKLVQYSIKKTQNQEQVMKRFPLFSHYCNSWPKQDMTNMVYWGPNVVLKIRSQYLIQFRAQLLMQANQIYKAFCKCVQEEIGGKVKQIKVQEIFPPDQFKWAINIARSRHIPQCQFDDYLSNSISTIPMIIAPLVDYINHPPVGEKANVKIELLKQDGSQYINLVAMEKIKRGQQLYMNYGDVCTSQFLNKYGFANQYRGDSFNAKTKIIAKFDLHNQFQSILREQIQLKQKVIQDYNKFGIKQQGAFAFCLNSDYQDELKYLRLMLMSAEDLYHQKISNQDILQGRVDFSRNLSPQQLKKQNKVRLRDQNEYRVAKVFQSTLMQFYRPFSTQSRIEIEDWRKVESIQSVCLNYIHNFEDQEKRILVDAKKFLKKMLNQ